MISYDTFASADRWTREHFEHGIMLDLRDDFLFEWSEDPTDRVLKAFPKNQEPAQFQVFVAGSKLVEVYPI